MDKLGRDELFYKIVDLDEVNAIRMIDSIKNINYQDVNGYSYLHAAVQSGSIRIVQELINNGAEINIKDKFGKTPLMVAIAGYADDVSIINLLLDNGADKSMKANSGVSCMNLAEMKGLSL